MTIAITAATGQLGRLAIASLVQRGGHPIALARDLAKAANLGVEARSFDYRAPNSASLEGVSVLVLISSNDFDDRAGQHRAALSAAKAAGVGHVIYTSILKGEANPMILAQDHIKTEATLRDSGLPHTILRNGWYTENYTASLAGAVAHGVVAGAADSGLLSTAARADYAEAIAAVALSPEHQGQVHELAGDVAWQMAELAAEVSRHAGKPIRFANLSEPDYKSMLIGFGLPEGFATALADADAKAAQGMLHDTSRTLSSLIGRATTPLSVSVAAALA
jgi:NAD(P)H dehydrogenase (quinone)